MNKKLLLIWTFLLCFVMGMSADEATAVIKFKDTGTKNDGSNSKTAMADLVTEESQALIKTFTATGKVFQAQTGLGIKFGNSSTAGSVSITLAKAYKPTKIVVNAAGYDAKSASITVNGTELTGLPKKKLEAKVIDCDGKTEVSEITVGTTAAATRGYVESITIYYNSEEGGGSVTPTPTCATPTIEGTTPFFGTTTVTLACATADAKIYYTLDGTEPTNANTEYTEPFTLDASATVKAIAYNGETPSTVATKEFVAAPVVATVADLTALAQDAVFLYNGELTVVAAPTPKYLYVKDAAGNTTLLFDAAGGFAFEAGQHIAAGWQGKIDVYKGLFEVVPTTALTAVADVKDEIVYDTKTAADVTLENVNTVAYLKGVTYTAPAENSKNFEIKQGDATVAGYNQFAIEIATPEADRTYDILGVISRYNDNVQFQPISITRNAITRSIDVFAENDGDDISALVETEKNAVVADGDNVGDILVVVRGGKNYTASKTIEINGAFNIAVHESDGIATIDASQLVGPFVQMATPNVEADANGFYHIGDINFNDVKITGLAGQLFYANKQKVLIDNLNFAGSILQVNGGNKTVFDTNGGGVIANLNIQNSTIYANPQNTGALYSSQSGQKATDAGLETQTISINSSTLYNIAYGKNVNNHRQSNQTWLSYVLSNSIVLDCGKDGQFVKGLNGGQSGANPTWAIANNSFLRTVDGVIEDHSSLESTGDADEPVRNNVEDYTTFADLANGDFTVEAGSLQAKMKVGDPRWLVEYDATKAHPKDVKLNLTEACDVATAVAEAVANVDKVNSVSVNLAGDVTYTANAPISVAWPFAITSDGKATVDAAQNAGAFIALSETPSESMKVEGNDYYHIFGYVSLDNLNINNVKGQLVYDNNVKYCVANLTVNNCKVQLASDEATGINGNAVIYFKAGFADNLSVSNSTFWNTGASDAKYFVQYNNSGRADRAGYQTQSIIYQNNTFYNVAKAGQWGNYNGFAGQNYSIFIVTDNIFANCGSAQIARRILGSRGASSYPEGQVVFNNNTYMTKALVEGVETTTYESKDGIVDSYDVSGTAIEMDPLFVDAANADFHIGASTKQAKIKTGDPRWLVDYVAEDITDAKAELEAEIANATTLLGNADTETDENAKALKDAIDKARQTLETAEFNADLKKATEELKAAEEAYKATDAVKTVNAEVNAADGAWYTIQGVRVANPSKGVFIHNGKKVVLK